MKNTKTTKREVRLTIFLDENKVHDDDHEDDEESENDNQSPPAKIRGVWGVAPPSQKKMT